MVANGVNAAGSGGGLRALDNLGLAAPGRKPLAFIIHGHDDVTLLQSKNFLQNTLKWQEPIILR
jgi:predicted nucleotide-binding protein